MEGDLVIWVVEVKDSESEKSSFLMASHFANLEASPGTIPEFITLMNNRTTVFPRTGRKKKKRTGYRIYLEIRCHELRKRVWQLNQSVLPFWCGFGKHNVIRFSYFIDLLCVICVAEEKLLKEPWRSSERKLWWVVKAGGVEGSNENRKFILALRASHRFDNNNMPFLMSCSRFLSKVFQCPRAYNYIGNAFGKLRSTPRHSFREKVHNPRSWRIELSIVLLQKLNCWLNLRVYVRL